MELSTEIGQLYDGDTEGPKNVPLLTADVSEA